MAFASHGCLPPQLKAPILYTSTIENSLLWCSMSLLPTEPIGSIPRPPSLLAAIEAAGSDEHPDLIPLYEEAIRDTVALFEKTGSPVVTDGEQRKYHNFWTYCVHGLRNTAPDGFKIPFAAGHVRRMPRLTEGPFRYKRYADAFLDGAKRYATVHVKQAVISPSAMSLMYPAEGLKNYSREEFIDDLLREHETEVRRCLQRGAHKVQVDFTEGRLAMKIDPSGNLLDSFVDLNNLALSRFSAADRQRIGIHTCPGGDRDSTHSADVDYEQLLPSLFELKAGNFYVALAGEKDPVRVLKVIRRYMKPDQNGVRRRGRADRPSGGDGRASARPHPAGGRIHSAGSTGHHRRLWFFPLLRRHIDHSRDRFPEDSGTGRRQRARFPEPGVVSERRRRRRAAQGGCSCATRRRS